MNLLEENLCVATVSLFLCLVVLQRNMDSAASGSALHSVRSVDCCSLLLFEESHQLAGKIFMFLFC